MKRKKERRKQRTKSQVQPSAALAIEEGSEEDEDEDEDEDEEGNVDGMDVVEVLEEEEIPAVETKKEVRPKKKRKLDEDSGSSSSSSASEDEQEPPKLPSRSTPPAALPSFPLPIAPKAPSKATLALQGLDKALLNAELIDPSRTLPLDALERPSDEVPVLSEKMKKRLVDLGISELFAGARILVLFHSSRLADILVTVQTALLPFLLPPQKRHRALYMPYDPPRDVCASAPTGSGKTLAYVVPIVEVWSSLLQAGYKE